MYVGDNSRYGNNKLSFSAPQNRGPYTVVRSSLQQKSNKPNTRTNFRSGIDDDYESSQAKPARVHTFNINMNALKNNYKYYQRCVPKPQSLLPKTKSRIVMNEQRDLYRQHRERMANIKGKVNTYLPPPKIKVEGNHMELSYMEMLAALYRKSNNTLRTFTKSPERLAAGRWRNVCIAREKEKKQQEKNRNFFKGGGLFDKNLGKSKSKKQHVNKTFSYEIPLHVLHRYEMLMDKCDVGVLCKLLRPQIYIDVEVRGTGIHGRLTIQLFTEACPEMVLEFMRICTVKDKRRISFTRTFSPIWLEGKIAMDPDRSIDMSSIEHDFEVLNHGVDAGILSFPSRYVRGNMRSAVSFTISFKPLSILNGKRIAFGKVRKGMALLERIQDATSHLIKTNDLVTITSCGVL